MKYQGPLDKWPLGKSEPSFSLTQFTLGILIAFALGAAIAMALEAAL